MSALTSEICRKCSPALIFMLFLQTTHAQTDFSGLTTIINKNEKSLGKEYVVLVNKAGKNIFLKETEDLKIKTPAPVASCSKWFTAAIVMKFVEDGKIDLDEPVSKYLPIYEKYMKGYITLRHCLTHTTGIEGDALGILRFAQKNKFASLEEEVNNFASKRLIIDNPGTHFSYSGIGLNIAARVLEVITKKTFDKISQEKLFKPLGMKNTSFYNENGAINPSGGAISTAFDYSIFMQMILNKGELNGKRILSEKSIEMLCTNQFPEAQIRSMPEVAKGFTYAMGNWIQEKDENGKGFVFSSPGLFGTWPWIDTKRNYVAIVFVKSLLTDQKRDIYMKIKESIDQVVQ